MKKNITLGAVALSLALLPAVTFAQGLPKPKVNTSATGTKATLNKEALTPEAIKCVKTALGKRDDAIIASFTTYSGVVTTALNARKTAINDSWAKATNKERLAARDAAWEAYKKAVKEANTKMMATKKTAHEAFSKEAKACKVSTTGEDKRADLI